MDATATRQRRYRAANRGLAVAGVVLLALAVLLAVRSPGMLRRSSECGDRSTVEVGGVAQTCTFDDEFDGTSLDPVKWGVIRTAQIGFHSGFECFVDNDRHVGVGRGRLTLSLSASEPGTGCRRLGLPYESGMVTSRNRFAQAYGRFTIRAKLPAAPGMQPALWLYPQRLTYGRWPDSGEIDIAEVFGSAAQTWPHLHYRGAAGTEVHPGQACAVRPSRGGFHTYSVDWTPTSFTFRYDSTLCERIDGWTPAAPLAAPAPFNRPFFVALEFATGIGRNSPARTMALPQTMQVDYVRVWGRAGHS